MKRTFTPSPSAPAATTPSREAPFDRVGRLLSQHHQWYVEPEYNEASSHPPGHSDEGDSASTADQSKEVTHGEAEGSHRWYEGPDDDEDLTFNTDVLGRPGHPVPLPQPRG